MSTLDIERGAGPIIGKRRVSGGGGGNYVGRGRNHSAKGAAVAASPFYYKSDSGAEREWTAWIVPMFAVANVAFFVASMYVNNCPAHSTPYGSCVLTIFHRISFQPLRQNPLLGPSSSSLEKLGALVWDKIVHQHQGWRLITCIWLHAGVLHLLANMLSLVFIGIHLEQQFWICTNWCCIPSFWFWREYLVIAFYKEQCFCWSFWTFVWAPWSNAIRAYHKLDHLYKQGCSYIDTADYYCDQHGCWNSATC